MVNKSYTSIKDILTHAPVLGSLGIGAQPIIMDGSLKIQKSEVIIIKYKSLDPTTFLLGLALGMTQAGNRFTDLKCAAASPVIYFNGNRSYEDVTHLAGRLSDKTENKNFTMVSRDMLANSFEMDVLNPVWQARIEEHIKENEDVGAVVFDSSESLFQPPFDEKTTLQLRRFIIQLRQLHVTQIWALSESNKKLDFPTDLATKIWSLRSTDNLLHPAITIKVEKDSMAPDEQLEDFTIELQDTSEGGLKFVNRATAVNDLKLSLNLIGKGMTQKKIGDILGVNQSTIHHRFKKLKEQGLMSQSGHTYKLTAIGENHLKD